MECKPSQAQLILDTFNLKGKITERHARDILMVLEDLSTNCEKNKERYLRVKDLLVKEIAEANMKGEKTERLTRLFNQIV